MFSKKVKFNDVSKCNNSLSVISLLSNLLQFNDKYDIYYDNSLSHFIIEKCDKVNKETN